MEKVGHVDELYVRFFTAIDVDAVCARIPYILKKFKLVRKLIVAPKMREDGSSKALSFCVIVRSLWMEERHSSIGFDRFPRSDNKVLVKIRLNTGEGGERSR